MRSLDPRIRSLDPRILSLEPNYRCDIWIGLCVVPIPDRIREKSTMAICDADRAFVGSILNVDSECRFRMQTEYQRLSSPRNTAHLVVGRFPKEVGQPTRLDMESRVPYSVGRLPTYSRREPTK